MIFPSRGTIYGKIKNRLPVMLKNGSCKRFSFRINDPGSRSAPIPRRGWRSGMTMVMTGTRARSGPPMRTRRRSASSSPDPRIVIPVPAVVINHIGTIVIPVFIRSRGPEPQPQVPVQVPGPQPRVQAQAPGPQPRVRAQARPPQAGVRPPSGPDSRYRSPDAPRWNLRDDGDDPAAAPRSAVSRLP